MSGQQSVTQKCACFREATRVRVRVCVCVWIVGQIFQPSEHACVLSFVMFGQVSMLNKWHALGSLIPNSDGSLPEAGFFCKASTHVRICAIYFPSTCPIDNGLCLSLKSTGELGLHSSSLPFAVVVSSYVIVELMFEP